MAKKTMSQRVSEWTKQNATCFTLKFNNKNDKDIIAKLKGCKNKTQYIAGLIRNDLEKPSVDTIFTLEQFAKTYLNNDTDKARIVFNNKSVWYATRPELMGDTRIVGEIVISEGNITAKVRTR